ncbi:hypothetical protein F511_39272 [Dorcoceras hygrometricum]|uniref:Uncharacterized protein n=1 Tax=Dorcoceras hygrometricum TaxID=472368 RepID=A0A2Z7A9F5_9LAMI|nr:hypothetical protein F511_39272 [Dorcoceras hygrometricum]
MKLCFSATADASSSSQQLKFSILQLIAVDSFCKFSTSVQQLMQLCFSATADASSSSQQLKYFLFLFFNSSLLTASANVQHLLVTAECFAMSLFATTDIIVQTSTIHDFSYIYHISSPRYVQISSSLCHVIRLHLSIINV